MGGVARDEEVARLRVPPHSTEAEQSVLGGLLLENLAWDKCSDLLTDSDFYRHEHRHIYAAIGSLIASSKPADVITVFEALQSLGKAEDCGGLAYLNALAQSVPSASNVRRYAEIVRERSVLRKLISASDEIATTAFNPQGQPVSQILDEAESRIFRIGEEGSRGGAGFQPMDKLVQALIDRVQELEANGSEDVTGIRTGFYDLDRMTAGLQKGDLIVLAARPSMGKTAFALNIAEHVAVQEGLPVAVFSMEMGASQLALRVVGSLGRIDQQHLRTGRLRDDEWERLPEAASKLSEAPMFIDETPGLNPAELRARARSSAGLRPGVSSMNIGASLSLLAASGRRSHSSSRRRPVRRCCWSMRPREPTTRKASCDAPISMENTATGSPSCTATCSAMFRAKAVLPMEGRAASTIRSPFCRPAVMRSRS